MRRPSTPRPSRLAVALVAVVGLTGLALVDPSTVGAGMSTHRPAVTTPPKKRVAPLAGTINVFAAASLSDAFQLEAAVFKWLAPRVTINVNVGASSTLATQITQGAQADVFASADESNMRRVSAADQLASDALIFAHNRLTILTPKGNPAKVRELTDLDNPGIKVSLCAETVPCGKFAKQILGNAQVDVTPVSLEDNVKGVVTKVALGEVDAGIAYVSDGVAAGPWVTPVRIPDEQNVINAYPVAIPKSVRNDRAARTFALFLFTNWGQAILRRYGFLPA